MSLSVLIWLNLGLFTLDCMGQPSTFNQDNSSTKQDIIQDIIDLSVKTENMSKEVDKFVKLFAKNFSTSEHSYYVDQYRVLLERTSSNRQCDSLRNSFEMIITHIKEILQQCYERTQRLVESLMVKANTLRIRIMDEITRWTTNSSNRIGYRLSSESFHKIGKDIENETRSRIQSIKKTLERFQIVKNLRELESNLSLRFCGVVANSYAEETKSLFDQLKECLLPQGEETNTTSNDTELTTADVVN